VKLKGNVDVCDFLYYRRFSGLLTRAFAKTSISPDTITLISLSLTLIVGILFSTGNRPALLSGVVLLQIARIFDCSDGELARLRGETTEFGGWLDSFSDRLKEVLIFGGVTVGSYRIYDTNWVLILGMFALANVLLSGFMLSIKSNLSFMRNNPAVKVARGVYVGGVSTHILFLSLAVVFDLVYHLLFIYATVMAFLWIGQAYLVIRRWKKTTKQ